MTTTELIASNVRARMAWRQLTKAELADAMNWSLGTAYNKINGLTRFTDDELDRLASLFDLDGPGDLFRVPPGFDACPQSRCTGDVAGHGAWVELRSAA